MSYLKFHNLKLEMNLEKDNSLIFQVKSWKRLFSGSQEEIVVLAV